nr:hypothetical protein [Oscillospiraceae bacterium]
MAEVYEAVVNRILINLARHFQYINAGEVPSGTWIYQAKKLAEMGQVTRETEQIILNMLGDADGALRALLEESILNGLKDAEPALRKAAEKGFLPGGINTPPVLEPGQMQAFAAYYKQSADKLNLVNTVMLESTQWAYQATVSDIVTRVNNAQGILNVATGEVVTGVSSWNQAVKQGVQKMVENGLTGFVDHGGHKWSPEAYVSMDVRTTLANTARAAVEERMDAYGADLYQMSWHNAARPLCYPWQGKVFSRSGNAGEVEDGEGNTVTVHTEDEPESFGYGGGPFGVNCGHYKIPFIPGFSRIRQPMQDAEENAKAYEQSQKQRYLERRLREKKRDLDVMKAQGASEEELKWQRQRIKEASGDIDEFCAKTGRTRRRDRETAPVRATWPAEAGEVTRYNQGYISTTQTPPPKGPPPPSSPPTPPPATPPATPPAPPSAPPAARAVVQTVVQTVAQQATQPAQTVVQSKSDLVEKILPNTGIQKVELQKWATAPTDQEIIDTVAGADMTSGSCASAALAYAGNRAGYQVRDFRGGSSMEFFARKSNTTQLAQIKGIDGIIINKSNEIRAANELLAQMEEGKEYWMGVGRHASIVRKGANGYEYLELQSADHNGWHPLTDDVLSWRFGCSRRRKYSQNARLMDVEKLAASDDFREVLPYINTAADQQRKGAGGGIK